MAADQTEFHKGIPARQSQAGDSSEYYGIPLRNNKGYVEMLYTGQSQPTSPTRRSDRHNYETSRSIPRSYKRHENRQPPDAENRRDEGTNSFFELKVVIMNIRSRITFIPFEPRASFLRILFVGGKWKFRYTKTAKRVERRTWKSSSQLSTNV